MTNKGVCVGDVNGDGRGARTGASDLCWLQKGAERTGFDFKFEFDSLLNLEISLVVCEFVYTVFHQTLMVVNL